jgi:hypothetical protein
VRDGGFAGFADPVADGERRLGYSAAPSQVRGRAKLGGLLGELSAAKVRAIMPLALRRGAVLCNAGHHFLNTN